MKNDQEKLEKVISSVFENIEKLKKRCADVRKFNELVGGARSAADSVEAYMIDPTIFYDFEGNLGFLERTNLDVIALVITPVLLVFFLLWRCAIRHLLSCCKSGKKKKD